MRKKVALLLVLVMLVAMIPVNLTSQGFGGTRTFGNITGRVAFLPGDIDGDRVVGAVELHPDPIAVHIPLSAIAGLANPVQFTFNNANSVTLDRWGHSLEANITTGGAIRWSGNGTWTSGSEAFITNWHSFGTSVGEVSLPASVLDTATVAGEERQVVQNIPGAHLNLTVMVRPFYDANNTYHWRTAHMSLQAIGGGGTLSHQISQNRTLLQGQALVGLRPISRINISTIDNPPNFTTALPVPPIRIHESMFHTISGNVTVRLTAPSNYTWAFNPRNVGGVLPIIYGNSQNVPGDVDQMAVYAGGRFVRGQSFASAIASNGIRPTATIQNGMIIDSNENQQALRRLPIYRVAFGNVNETGQHRIDIHMNGIERNVAFVSAEWLEIRNLWLIPDNNASMTGEVNIDVDLGSKAIVDGWRWVFDASPPGGGQWVFEPSQNLADVNAPLRSGNWSYIESWSYVGYWDWNPDFTASFAGYINGASWIDAQSFNASLSGNNQISFNIRTTVPLSSLSTSHGWSQGSGNSWVITMPVIGVHQGENLAFTLLSASQDGPTPLESTNGWINMPEVPGIAPESERVVNAPPLYGQTITLHVGTRTTQISTPPQVILPLPYTPSDPPTPTHPIAPRPSRNLPANNNGITVPYRQQGNTATLNLNTSLINTLIRDSESAVLFDITDLSNVTTAVIGTSAWNRIANAELGIDVQLPQGTLAFNSEAAQSIGNQAQGGNISTKITTVNPESLPQAQVAGVRVGDYVFQIEVTAGNRNITEFEGNLATTVAFGGTPPVSAWRLNSDGTLTQLAATFQPAAATVTFYTNQLSLFVIGQYTQQDSTPPEPAIGGLGFTPALLRLAIGNATFTQAGIPRQADTAPFIDPDTSRTMIPLRIVAENMGADVSFNEITQTVHINHAGTEHTLTINIPLPNNMGTAVIINNRTFVPARYVSEILGATVRWDEIARAVYIYR